MLLHWEFAGRIVLEALILTSAVVASLTGYTFWASKKGKDFSYLGPILFTSLFTLFLAGFIQVYSSSLVLTICTISYIQTWLSKCVVYLT